MGAGVESGDDNDDDDDEDDDEDEDEDEDDKEARRKEKREKEQVYRQSQGVTLAELKDVLPLVPTPKSENEVAPIIFALAHTAYHSKLRGPDVLPLARALAERAGVDDAKWVGDKFTYAYDHATEPRTENGKLKATWRSICSLARKAAAAQFLKLSNRHKKRKQREKKKREDTKTQLLEDEKQAALPNPDEPNVLRLLSTPTKDNAADDSYLSRESLKERLRRLQVLLNELRRVLADPKDEEGREKLQTERGVDLKLWTRNRAEQFADRLDQQVQPLLADALTLALYRACVQLPHFRLPRIISPQNLFNAYIQATVDSKRFIKTAGEGGKGEVSQYNTVKCVYEPYARTMNEFLISCSRLDPTVSDACQARAMLRGPTTAEWFLCDQTWPFTRPALLYVAFRNGLYYLPTATFFMKDELFEKCDLTHWRKDSLRKLSAVPDQPPYAIHYIDQEFPPTGQWVFHDDTAVDEKKKPEDRTFADMKVEWRDSPAFTKPATGRPINPSASLTATPPQAPGVASVASVGNVTSVPVATVPAASTPPIPTARTAEPSVGVPAVEPPDSFTFVIAAVGGRGSSIAVATVSASTRHYDQVMTKQNWCLETQFAWYYCLGRGGFHPVTDFGKLWPYLSGPSNSGKTKLLHPLIILISKHLRADMSINAQGTFGLEQVLGKLVLIVGEAHQMHLSECFPEAVVLLLAAGGENITVPKKYVAAETIPFTAGFFASGNGVPGYKDEHKQVRNRLLVFPCEIEVPAREQDLTLDQKIEAEIGAILDRANTAFLEGRKRMQGRPLRSFLSPQCLIQQRNAERVVDTFDQFVRDQLQPIAAQQMDDWVQRKPGGGNTLVWKSPEKEAAAHIHAKPPAEPRHPQPPAAPPSLPRLCLDDIRDRYKDWVRSRYGDKTQPHPLTQNDGTKQRLWNLYRVFVTDTTIKDRKKSVRKWIVFGVDWKDRAVPVDDARTPTQPPPPPPASPR